MQSTPCPRPPPFPRRPASRWRVFAGCVAHRSCFQVFTVASTLRLFGAETPPSLTRTQMRVPLWRTPGRGLIRGCHVTVDTWARGNNRLPSPDRPRTPSAASTALARHSTACIDVTCVSSACACAKHHAEQKSSPCQSTHHAPWMGRALAIMKEPLKYYYSAVIKLRRHVKLKSLASRSQNADKCIHTNHTKSTFAAKHAWICPQMENGRTNAAFDIWTH